MKINVGPYLSLLLLRSDLSKGWKMEQYREKKKYLLIIIGMAAHAYCVLFIQFSV